MSSTRSGGSDPARSEAPYHLAQEWAEENNEEESDVDFQPSSERSEDTDAMDQGEESAFDEEEMRDLIDGGEDPGIQIEFIVEDSDQAGEQPEEQTGNATETGATRVTTQQLYRLLGANGLRRILQTHGLLRDHGTQGDSDDEGYVFGSDRLRRRRRQKPPEDLYPKIPSEAGAELMASGAFGSNPYHVDRDKKRRTTFAKKMMWRELGTGPRGSHLRDSRAISQGLIPGTPADKIIHYDSRCYSGQFSDDGNFFFSCAQDFKVRMYDTSSPYNWKYYKTVVYPFGQWTITDASLSPDNRFLAYSSIRNVVCLAGTDPESNADPMLLDFSKPGSAGNTQAVNPHFGIWSLRFSGDGREIVAGTSDRAVIVYDIETQQPTLRLQKHDDDVNAVCFGDKTSPHILYSGSDDTTLRVWDRRSMGDGRAAGVFMGHTEGLTYVDSKGDGRYVLSNGKDQFMKLWDLRKMMTTAKFDTIDPTRYSSGFDYRFMSFTDDDYQPHPHDCSVVSFRGHSVLRTLIRCHFSPPTSTNSRYVYTGSEDGKVYIYNLDATLAGVINVGLSTRLTRPMDSEIYTSPFNFRRDNAEWKTCVRDASWHPDAPILAATSWNGWGMSTGTCTVHSWNDGGLDDEGDTPLGQSYNDKLEYVSLFNHYTEATRRQAAAHDSSNRLRSQPLHPEPMLESSDDDGEIW